MESNVAAPPKKKHTLAKILLILVLLFVVLVGALFVVGLMAGDDSDYEPYNDTTVKKSKTSTLVTELAAGGDSLTPGYAGGEYGVWGVTQQADGLRDHYVSAENAKSVTVMVYMIGSNLESENGSATDDLKEMIASRNGKNLNIVVQTGGSTEWKDLGISADTRQRWLIQNGKFTEVDDIGQGSMCTREALADFVSWSAQTYPADRYMLVLWDHGGGTLGGFGQDDNYPNDNLDLYEMAGAVSDSGVKLDIMSFDACLMATLEVGYAFEPYADYLLASEETEPGYGWDYTKSFKALSDDPSMPTLELGARLIDDYGSFYGNDDVTLSLLDLREIPALYQACVNYYQQADTMLQTQDGFTELSVARSKSRSYAEGQCEQIDLVDYVQRTDVKGGEELIRALFSAVKYRNRSDLSGSYGLATYFPYTSPDYYQTVMSNLTEVGCNGAEDFYNSFLSILAGGSGGNQSGVSQVTGYQEAETDYSNEDWYNAALGQTQDYNTVTDTGELTINYSEAEGAYTLSLPDSSWESITDIQLQVMLDDGEGYIDLGSDQQYNWAQNGDLLVDFDNTWTSLDGQPVAFYALMPVTSGDTTVFSGTVPALLNGETPIDIYLEWDQDADGNAQSYVLGYLPADDSNTLPKGYFTFQAGDEIQPVCDYYTYDGEYDDQYLFGDPITVTSQDDLVVDSYDLEDASTICWLQLTDWYLQNWYTETVQINFDQTA